MIKLDMEQTDFMRLLVWAAEQTSPEGQLLYKIFSEKLDRMVDRELYTQYKRAATPGEREAARQKYLDKKGIPDSFRW